MNGFFIDKLNVAQDHALTSSGLVIPDFTGVKYFRVDLETGDTTDLTRFSGLEGSFSSYLSIRVTGSKVEVYGNPSRWGRIDNLFGFQTLDECMDVYNQILEGLGLPKFTKCNKYLYLSGKDGAKQTKTADGAIIRHIDFTKNHSVGEGNERAFIKAMSTQSINKSHSPFMYPDENTVEWYGANIQKKGSTYRYIKIYNKTSDLLRHKTERVKNATYDDYLYYEKLINFTFTQGVIREEHSFKRPYLLKYDLFAWGLFSEQAFNDELEIITKTRKKLTVHSMNYETIADTLLNEGICKNRQSANATANYYSLWLHGAYMDQSKSQFREHKARLKQIGIDISVKLDISRHGIRIKDTQLIECKPLSMPDWYRQPTLTNKPHLRLVA